MKAKQLDVVAVSAPPVEQRVQRPRIEAVEGERRTRYTHPQSLESDTVVGYRTRVALSPAEAKAAMPLLSLERPSVFEPSETLIESELFEECALGVMSSRQSTNYRGFRQVTVGPEQNEVLRSALQGLEGLEAPALDHATHTHIVLAKPYRTPFTMLLTLAGHKPLLNLLTVPYRIFRKRFFFDDDIPTIGFLPHLHIGILADGMERAAVLASSGRRRAQIFMAPFCDRKRKTNRGALRSLEALAGLTAAERREGWTVALVAQVGAVPEPERLPLSSELCRRLAANCIAFRSERTQPGVNQDESAPEAYQHRQDMDVSEELTVMAGRAAYNAFAHWMGCTRDEAKERLLMERIDVLTPGGKTRLRAVRKMLNDVTDRLIRDFPLWADLPAGRAFSKNANRGRKAFALAGQRIYVAGLARRTIEKAGHDWLHAVRAAGAAAARSALYCELMGCVDLPDDCDLLVGMCLMAGPVNLNDIGKQFYELSDLLESDYPGLDPTSLLVWTLKGKTVTDPIGNEQQLMSKARKGALVDLRPGPHELVSVRRGEELSAFREEGGRHSQERAFSDVGNFVSDIPGNEGERWPEALRSAPVWD